MKQVIFRREARRDVLDAHRWYRERSPRLGDRFRDALDATIARMRQNPLGYQVLFREVRRALLRRFPYAVFFKNHEEVVIVIAVLHMRRDPDAWKSRA
jgi:plasmid stabilization system protein ParE